MPWWGTFPLRGLLYYLFYFVLVFFFVVVLSLESMECFTSDFDIFLFLQQVISTSALCIS